MQPPPLMTLYLRQLAAVPQYLGVVFGLFAVLAYGYACSKQRRLLWSWADIRHAIVPAEVYRARTVRFDIAIFWMQAFFILPAITFVGSLYTAEQLAHWITARAGAPAVSLGGHSIAVTFVQLFASQILGTFGAYVFHVAGHKLPLFWSLHKVHHSAEALSPFTASRGHPLDTLFGVSVSFAWRTLVVGLALYVTGGQFTTAALGVLACSTLASLVQDALNHSHVPLCYGWLNRIWVGPSFHHIHHSIEMRHRDKNFGGGVPVWDWLFGTMYLPDPDERYLIGLNAQEMGEANPHNSFKGYVIAPTRDFAVELGKLVWPKRIGRETDLPRGDYPTVLKSGG
jgi:sterol desaturase/sphingolipid hydroxylase (fatty acid hydroxylase superfamily)